MSISHKHDWSRFLAPAAVNFPLGERNAGKCILITGAGGSIGSALVLAAASERATRILLLDSSERDLFEVLQQLETRFPRVAHEAILGSCGDPALLDSLLAKFRPGIIYHAAAFKHIPLLERNPFAAVRNNAIATYALAQAASRHQTPKLVLVSTDKAVNPCSMLGVTKRISELAIVSLSNSYTRMNALRLVNVIGSSGSVVPIFRCQIAAGGPVTVTHPEALRRFVSLREAIDAILAAGDSHSEGKILLPAIDDPVNIADLARFLIDACAPKQCQEIPIRFTGLRPGEKLAEDLLFASEIKEGTIEGCLEVIQTPTLAPWELTSIMEQLAERETNRDFQGLMEALHRAVPEYCSANSRAGC